MGCGIKPQNLAIYQGDDWAALITVNNCDGTPADLTGYNAQAQLRTGPADQAWSVAAEMTCAIVLPNQVSLSLTHDQTTLLGDLQYSWDLQLVDPSGIITTILAGQVNVTLEVTRGPFVMPVVEQSLVWVRDPQWRNLYWTDAEVVR